MKPRKNAHAALVGALPRLARPLMRICFRGGVSVGEIRAALDHAAVREAEAYLVEIGKKPTFSNISIITGIARHTVRALMTADDADAPPRGDGQLHRAVRVLNGWHEDPQFTDASGHPRVLAVRGRARSFEALVRRYAGGIGYAAILERLVETRAVEVLGEDADGRPLRVRALRPQPAADVDEARRFDEFGEVFGDALEGFDATLAGLEPERGVRPLTLSATVHQRTLKLVRRLLLERGETALRSVDASLRSHDLPPEEARALSRTSPAELYDVRVTLLSTIRPAHPSSPVVESAWRRRPPRTDDEDDA